VWRKLVLIRPLQENFLEIQKPSGLKRGQNTGHVALIDEIGGNVSSINSLDLNRQGIGMILFKVVFKHERTPSEYFLWKEDADNFVEAFNKKHRGKRVAERETIKVNRGHVCPPSLLNSATS
jgi:hypothetical protein